MIANNIGLAIYAARPFMRAHRHLADELRSAALLALVRAVYAFDPDREDASLAGVIVTRCRWACVNAIRDALVYAERYPRELPIHGEDGDELAAVDLLASDPAPEQDVGRHVEARAVRAAVAELPAREREIVEQRFLEPDARTLEQIGEVLHLSRERVRQIEVKVLGKLRFKLS